jgi:hypothetical protein
MQTEILSQTSVKHSASARVRLVDGRQIQHQLSQAHPTIAALDALDELGDAQHGQRFLKS